MQLTPGQHGLQQVAGIHGTVGFAGAHNGVQFINEEDDLAFALLDLVQNALQALLKFAPVLGTGHQSAHVQAEHLAVLQVVGHIAPHDPLGKALGDGGFAHAGLADQAGVVLALPAQNADDVPDFLVTADHRVQLVLLGQAYQLLTVLLQYVVGVFGVVAGHPLVAAQGGQLVQEVVLVDGEGPEQVAGRPVGGFQNAQEHMLHTDVFILHGSGLLLGSIQGLVGILADVDLIRVAAGAAHVGQLLHLFLGGHGKSRGLYAHALQQLGDKAVFLAGQSRQQMLRLQRLVLMFNGKALGILQSLHGFLCELVGVHKQQPSLFAGLCGPPSLSPAGDLLADD